MQIIKKDITTVTFGVVAHGCNCDPRGIMGSGVAKAIRSKWPDAYLNHKKYIKIGGPASLGSVHVTNISDLKLYVANCYTQVKFGSDGKRYADLQAIETTLTYVYGFCKFNRLPIYLPQIGCGLGGLDWDNEVNPIVEKLDSQFPSVDTYVCIL